MKRLMVVGLAALAVAAPASAAGPAPSAAKLQQQVKVLQTQVRTLQAQMKAQAERERFDRSEIQANYSGDACLAASVTDLFQATWALIDQGVAAPKFKKEPPVDDTGVCKSLGITRPGGALPPSIAALGALVLWLLG